MKKYTILAALLLMGSHLEAITITNDCSQGDIEEIIVKDPRKKFINQTETMNPPVTKGETTPSFSVLKKLEEVRDEFRNNPKRYMLLIEVYMKHDGQLIKCASTPLTKNLSDKNIEEFDNKQFKAMDSQGKCVCKVLEK